MGDSREIGRGGGVGLVVTTTSLLNSPCPGGTARSPHCLHPEPCRPSLIPPARSHQLSYYLSRHKPNYRPCPEGTVGFMGRVRRQKQAGVNPCPPISLPFFPPSLKLHLSHPNRLLSPLLSPTPWLWKYFLFSASQMLPSGFQPFILTLAFFPPHCEDLFSQINPT